MEAHEGPQPEALIAHEDGASIADAYTNAQSNAPKKARIFKRGSYRPNRRATIIGLAIVGLVLAANIGIVMFIMRSQAEAEQKARSEVTLSSETLDSLGVNRTAVGNEGAKLTVGPDSTFNGTVTIAKDVSVGGQLQLNSTFTASQANIAKLQAGETAMEALTVNGDISADSLLLRSELTVPGTTRLNGPVTMTQLLTVNNNLNVTGSLSVGGSLSVSNFQARSLTSDSTLTIGGHIVTRGAAPGVSGGGGLGQSGTATLSGSDSAGTISLGVGMGGGSGLLCEVSFTSNYGATPHIVVTPVGRYINLYINRTAAGFQVYTEGAIPPGGYALDYIVMG